MNQQPTMGAPKPAVSKWLWITLIVVAVAGAGFFSWYYLMGPGKKVATSTTPTTTSTTPSTTTTPSSTSTTSNSTTPSSSTSTGTTSTETTQTPPSGWKSVEGEVTGFKTYTGPVKYRIFLKNDWVRSGAANFSNYYGSENCYYDDLSHSLCPILISYDTTSNPESSDGYSVSVPNTKFYINMYFKDLSDNDKKIIKNSFTIL